MRSEGILDRLREMERIGDERRLRANATMDPHTGVEEHRPYLRDQAAPNHGPTPPCTRMGVKCEG
jgi:hypothetical protein